MSLQPKKMHSENVNKHIYKYLATFMCIVVGLGSIRREQHNPLHPLYILYSHSLFTLFTIYIFKFVQISTLYKESKDLIVLILHYDELKLQAN